MGREVYVRITRRARTLLNRPQESVFDGKHPQCLVPRHVGLLPVGRYREPGNRLLQIAGPSGE